MPDMKEGESKSEWMSRCVPVRIKEGDKQDQAVAVCMSMWRAKHGGEKPKAKLFKELEAWELDALARGHGLKKEYYGDMPEDDYEAPEADETEEEASLGKLIDDLDFPLDPTSRQGVPSSGLFGVGTFRNVKRAALFKDATVQSGHVTTAIGNSGTRGSKSDRKTREFNEVIADQSQNDLTQQAADIDAGKKLRDDEYETGNDIVKGAWSLPIKIEKTNVDKQQIFGWAYVSEDGGQIVVDKQGDIIPIEELEKAAYSYLLDSRDGGDMHERRGVMSTIESVVFTKDKLALGIKHDSGRFGWWVGFQVHDADLWKRIKKGEQLELSIGGASLSQEVENVDTWLKHRDVFDEADKA